MNATLTTDQQVSEFARAVRSHLSDLSPDEIDDLTDGLEADLSEHAHDSDLFTLGDPAAYASELRAAAGLPLRSTQRESIARSISSEARRIRTQAIMKIRSSKAASAAFDFLVSVRPAWWIARALLGFFLVASVVGSGIEPWANPTPLAALIGAVLLVISVQWGRRRWMPQRWIRIVRTLANLLAVLVIPFALSTVGTYVSTYNSFASNAYVPTPSGLTRNGNAITNIFAYDSDGNPISNVQLFDQNGRALSARQASDSYTYVDDDTYLVPSAKTAGGSGWNVFPLGKISPSDIDGDTGIPRTDVTPTAVLFPFVKVRPLIAVAPTSEPSASTDPSPSPSPSVDPSAIPSPSASPTP